MVAKKPAMPMKGMSAAEHKKMMAPGKPAAPGKAFGQSMKGTGRMGKGMKGKKGY